MNKKRIWLVVLGGILLVGAVLLSEQESKTKSELQQAEGELWALEHNQQIGLILLARMADSLSLGDSAYDAVADFRRRDQAAAEDLSTITIPHIQSKLLRERVLMWVCGICGVFFLMLYLRRVRRAEGSTE